MPGMMQRFKGMQRLLCTGDIHSRTGPRGELAVSRQLLRGIGETAVKNNCDTIVINGDLWDEKHGVRTEVHIMTWKEVNAWATELGRRVFLVRGNHEVDLDKGDPGLSMLVLYHQPEIGIHVINYPTRIPFADEGLLFMLPWFQPDAWLRYAAMFSKEAKSTGYAVLFSHIGIKEGTVSASNIYTINQRTSLIHIGHHCYDFVILNDYHKKQHLAENCFYTGAPTQLMHGDAPNQGVVILDLCDMTVCDARLEGGPYPQYRTVRIEKDCQIPFVLHSPDDYVRVQCPHEQVAVVRSMYQHPRWDVSGYSTAEDGRVSSSSDRLAKVEKNDHEQILNVWLNLKGLKEPRFKNAGMEYLINSEDPF